MRNDLVEKALMVIEFMVLECETEREGEIMIYAHVANDTCKNKHPDWVAQLEKKYQVLLEAGEFPREHHGPSGVLSLLEVKP